MDRGERRHFWRALPLLLGFPEGVEDIGQRDAPSGARLGQARNALIAGAGAQVNQGLLADDAIGDQRSGALERDHTGPQILVVDVPLPAPDGGTGQG